MIQVILSTAAAQCPDPGHVSNAVRFPANPFVGTRVTYFCNAGYTGGGTITCLSNGQWSSPRPTCSRESKKYDLYIISCCSALRVTSIFQCHPSNAL